MMHTESTIPYFMPTEPRQLSVDERTALVKVLANEAPGYMAQLDELFVVGRCGCGTCPTVFFQPHHVGDKEHELAAYVGRDSSGGVVGLLLYESGGRLSQLEFYAVDGHDPWSIPLANTLEKEVR